MRKKILSPAEREEAEKNRKAKRLAAFGLMVDDAVKKTMNGLIEPETGFSGLSRFENLQALNAICVCNNRKDQKVQQVYICAPNTGVDEEETEANAERARTYGRLAAALGRLPVVPHLVWPQELCSASPENRSFQRRLNVMLMTGCDELWVFRAGEDTGEMEAEILLARLLEKPIRIIEMPSEEE